MRSQWIRILGRTAFALSMFGFVATAAVAQPEVLATGLFAPVRLATTPAGNVLVAEGGMENNGGRISRVDHDGQRTSLLTGLPSGQFEGTQSGPTAMVLGDAQTLYFLIGGGNAAHPNGDGTDRATAEGPSSPLLSSLLRVRFSNSVDTLAGPFALDLDDHFAIARGHRVRVKNAAGQAANVRLMANFSDIWPDAVTVVRVSNPFGLAKDDNWLYVADASQNSLVRIPLAGGLGTTLTLFPQIQNNSGFGPPFIDAVPNSIHLTDHGFLMTVLSGFPFPAGASSVRRVGPNTFGQQTFIGGLTTAMDTAVVELGGQTWFYVLEFSANLLSQAPGRLLRFDAPGASSPQVVAAGLITPTALAYDAVTQTMFISELATGRLLALELN